MEQRTVAPSLRQVIWTDYPAFYATVIPVVAWIVCLAWVPSWRADGPILSPQAIPIYIGVAVALTLIGLGVVFWRMRLLRAVFTGGAQVKGRISAVSLNFDRGRVEYTYTYRHKKYQSGAPIHRNKQTRALKRGAPVTLVVDPSRPERAFIRDLYI